MPFEIHTHHEPEYFAVRYMGAVTTAERMRAIDEVFSQAEATGFHRVLVDLGDEQLETEDVAASIGFAARIARQTVDKGRRVAYVTRSSTRLDQALGRLAEAHHLPFKRFDRRMAALVWLLAE